jgi:hypothetical protein
MEHGNALGQWTFSGWGPLIFMTILSLFVGAFARLLSK